MPEEDRVVDVFDFSMLVVGGFCISAGTSLLYAYMYNEHASTKISKYYLMAAMALFLVGWTLVIVSIVGSNSAAVTATVFAVLAIIIQIFIFYKEHKYANTSTMSMKLKYLPYFLLFIFVFGMGIAAGMDNNGDGGAEKLDKLLFCVFGILIASIGSTFLIPLEVARGTTTNANELMPIDKQESKLSLPFTASNLKLFGTGSVFAMLGWSLLAFGNSIK